MIKYLKRLAFRLIQDDIDQILKLHDERIMTHYMKIIDDVEDILKERQEQLIAVIETEHNSMRVSSEERLIEIQRELIHEIDSNSVTVSQIVAELDLVELASELDYENLAASIDYSLINHKDLAKLVVDEPSFKIELDKANVKPLVQKIGQALIHYDDSRINSVRDALNILI